jgi:hypothetical protein
MKIKYLLLFSAVVAFSSCSTAYRSGQTPDDVYYSPAPQQNSYVSKVSEDDEDSYYYRNNEEDYNIRRGIENPVYRSPLSLNLGFGYSPYSFYPYNSFNSLYGYNNFGYNNFGYSPYGMKGLYNPYYYDDFAYSGLSFYSPYSMYNPYSLGYGYSPFGYGYGYSPYYYPISFSSKSINTNRGARMYNLNAYRNTSSGNSGRSGIGTVQPVRNTGITQPQSENTGVGRVIRRVFTPSERNSSTPPATTNNTRRNTRRNANNNNNQTRNNTYEAPQRTFTPSTPSSSSSSSSSSGSGSSAPVRTFRR